VIEQQRRKTKDSPSWFKEKRGERKRKKELATTPLEKDTKRGKEG